MIRDYIYGVISNVEDMCPVTGSNAYQVNWNIAHLSTGNSFLSFVAPYFEHDFTVVKFPDEDDVHDDVELTRQFKKDNGGWVSIEYGVLICDYCDSHTCDCVQYRDELDSMLVELAQMEVQPNKKRYRT